MRDNLKQVQFKHLGLDLWCDVAIIYSKTNKLRAIGNIKMKQGDSITMRSGYVDYAGTTNC